jgi:hypothetical protein
MFLKKLRTRRSSKADKIDKTKAATKESKSIFRKPTDAVDPEIEHVFTMSMSEDEEDVSVSSSSTVRVLSSIADDIDDSEVLTFTQRQIMDSELDHMRQLNKQQREMDGAFKASQARVLAEKEREMAEAKVDFETVLQEKGKEIATLKEEVIKTKEELSKVSTVLIRVQHELHEKKSSTWRMIGSW